MTLVFMVVVVVVVVDDVVVLGSCVSIIAIIDNGLSRRE
jgi:hypothetical protein